MLDKLPPPLEANLFTPDERISYETRANHPYSAAIEYATEHLGEGHGRLLLVVGSAPAEADAMAHLGWAVTLLDCRHINHPAWVQGDAMHMPFEDARFDAITSTCVLCHVGLGRYSDPIEERGDAKMMQECDRVLKPGGIACLMPGPVISGDPIALGSVHRITTLDAMWALSAYWFRTVGRRVFQASSQGWLPPGEAITTDWEHPDYLCVKLEKA